MWDDVIISKKCGLKYKGTGAILCFEIKGNHSISENSVSYWINLKDPLELSITIFKDTKEGEMLTHMIKQKEPLAEIERYILAIVIRKISPKILIKKIKELSDTQFTKGKIAKAEELRKVLEIQ